MATRRKRTKTTKSVETTEEESLQIISKYLQREGDEILNFKNHRKHNVRKNFFRFTVDMISLELIISLMEDEKIKNVYWNPSVPPPGAGVDGVSLRYKVYVEYHQ